MITSFNFFVSIAGIIYSITIAIYSVLDTAIQSSDSIYQHGFDNFFVWLNTGLSIIAWLLFLMASGTTTPLVAVLFILAEVVFIIKELTNLVFISCYDKQYRSPIPIRFSIELEAHEKKTWINLVSAVLLTGIISEWCMVPESLVVGVLSFIAMGIVYWKKHLEIEQIDAEITTALPLMNHSSDAVSMSKSKTGLFSRPSNHNRNRKDVVLLDHPRCSP